MQDCSKSKLEFKLPLPFEEMIELKVALDYMNKE